MKFHQLELMTFHEKFHEVMNFMKFGFDREICPQLSLCKTATPVLNNHFLHITAKSVLNYHSFFI
jgi:hypothetical protein